MCIRDSSYGLESVQESPARQAGLLKNDIITKFDGQGVSSAEDLSKLVAYYENCLLYTSTACAALQWLCLLKEIRMHILL